jgi:hypothetical protein
VRVTASGSGFDHLVAVLSAVTPAGKTIVVSDGAAGFLSFGAKPKTVTIRLPDEVTAVPRGSRLRVTLGATSTLQSPANLVYLNQVAATSKLSIRRVTLALPVLATPISG